MQINLVKATPTTECFGVSYASRGNICLDSGDPGTIGVILGLTASSVIGFYGSVPCTQPSVSAPNSVILQEVINALITLGLVAQLGE